MLYFPSISFIAFNLFKESTLFFCANESAFAFKILTVLLTASIESFVARSFSFWVSAPQLESINETNNIVPEISVIFL